MMGLDLQGIVGVARGGLVPGVLISHMLQLPFFPISYSSKKGVGDDRNHANDLPVVPFSNFLIVEDIIDSGHTMAEIAIHYTNTQCQHGEKIYTACLYYKDNPHIYPDLNWLTIDVDSPFVNFPWENAQLGNIPCIT
jgi:hypoxanthine phosphoribosyltransferase